MFIYGDTLQPRQIILIITLFGGLPDNLPKRLKPKDISIKSDGHCEEFPFTISDFDLALVEAGGWLEYADSNY